MHMEWLWLVGSIKLYVSFAKETYKRDDILQMQNVFIYVENGQCIRGGFG